MPTPSQKNAQEIIKLQGEIKLIHNNIIMLGLILIQMGQVEKCFIHIIQDHLRLE